MSKRKASKPRTVTDDIADVWREVIPNLEREIARAKENPPGGDHEALAITIASLEDILRCERAKLRAYDDAATRALAKAGMDRAPR